MKTVKDLPPGIMYGVKSSQPIFSYSGWKKRTRLEKVLGVCLGLTLIVLTVITTITIIRVFGETIKPSNVCVTPGCIKAAQTLIENMDPSVDPCEDFYEFACRGYENQVRIPDDESSRTQFEIIGNLLEEQLRDILDEDSDSVKNESKVFKMARDHYQACMDLDRLEEVGLEPLKSLLTFLGGWPVLDENWNEEEFKWDETNYALRKSGFDVGYLFDFTIGPDLKNSSHRIIYFDQPEFGMDREYLLRGMEDPDVQNYFNFMHGAAVLLGADPSRAHEELLDSLMFEIRLANASTAREERRNASKLYHLMTTHKMDEISSIVNWTTYVRNILTDEINITITPDEEVVVIAPEYLGNLTSILESEPVRNIANYMMWRAVKSSIGFLNKEALELFEDYTRAATGRLATTPRWKICVESAAGSFAAAIGKLYVTKHFKEDAKSAMLEMVEDIKDEFKMMIDQVSWMDTETRNRARQKLFTIKEYIAYVEEIKVNKNLEDLYDGLVVNNTHFFNNGINLSKWSTNYNWKKLRETIDKTDWKLHAQPAVVNAFYSASENSIQFPAGILQGLFFDKGRPQYLNYGGIGWVIGHEITHGFDDQGRQYDHEGNLRDWWDPETMTRFLNKTECMVQQYGNYTIPELNITLNGINTQGENIADNGGIKGAYKAYNRWVARHGEEATLPGLNFNQRQLFWLGAANIWCSKYRPLYLEKHVELGVHSPGKFRVIGPLSNSLDFARDFQCQPGTKMNPVKKCEVW